MAGQDTFVYMLKPVRPTLIQDATPEERAVLERHFAYLKELLAGGRLIIAGPCLDAAFGLVVFEAPSPDEAAATMEGDPAVRAGVMAAKLHPFRVSLLRGRD